MVEETQWVVIATPSLAAVKNKTPRISQHFSEVRGWATSLRYSRHCVRTSTNRDQLINTIAVLRTEQIEVSACIRTVKQAVELIT